MKINTAVISLIICCFLYATPAKATTLPQPIVNFLKTKYPDVEIRFDGLVELPDHTIYLPVTPLVYASVKNPAEIIKSIPAKTDFSNKPDMILFANNLALLKIVKSNNELTVNYSPEIPLSVKLGLLPQDLIVPRGLILPIELKVILGNLKVPLKPKKDEDDLVFFGTPEKNTIKNVNIISGKVKKEEIKGVSELNFIKDKVLYASNFTENLINIIDSASGRIYKNLKLPSTPSNMVLTNDERYLLIPSVALSKIFVIDTFNNMMLKDIPVGKFPSSVLLTADSKKAYIANRLSSSISEIELENMVHKRDIPVKGNPDNLIEAADKQNIYYNDTDSDNIYMLNLQSGIVAKVLKVNNISKIAVSGNYMFVLSRLNSELIVYDIGKKSESARIKVGEKPVDLKILDKKGEIYVLSAGSDEINIVDLKDFKLKKTIAINSGGFPNKITLLEKENRMLITNQDCFKISIFDITNEKIVGNIPVSKNISFLQIYK